MILQPNYSHLPESASPQLRIRAALAESKKAKAIDLSQYHSEAGVILFVRDILGIKNIAPYQEKILRALVKYKRVAARGPHGLGKTAVGSWFIIWFICVYEDDVKAITIASKYKQLEKYLWPEIRKWLRKSNLSKIGIEFRRNKELFSMGIRTEGKEAFAVASNNHEAIEGAHAKHLAYIYDESKAIPDAVFDASEGAFSTAGEDTDNIAYALMLSTPGAASGRFYEVHKRKPGYEDWHVIHITKEEVIAAGRMSQEWSEKRKRQWGENSAIYKMRVLGEFDTSGEKSVIPLDWIEAANDRWYECKGKGKGERSLGVDPARFGEDKTAIADKVGNVIESVEYHSKEDTMQTTGRVINMVEANKELKIGVDVDGVGGGVVDRLSEQRYNVTGINAGSKSNAVDVSGEIGFRNKRSEMWWMMRELLDPTYEHNISLPPDDLLTGDLTTPQYKYTSTGQIQVESKDDIKKRLGRSTDGADAVMIAFHVCFISYTPAIVG